MRSRKNLILISILFVLLVTFFITERMGSGEQSTFARDFPRVNPLLVTKLKIYSPMEAKEEVILFKSGEEWRALKGVINAPLHEGRIDILQGELDNLKPSRLAGISPDEWANFGLNDSASTRVIVESDDEVLIDFVIGKFQYYSSDQKKAAGKQGNETRGITYVRLSDGEEVYSADGFFGPNFNQSFETWRNQLFVKMDPHELDSIRFIYPENSVFTITTDEDHWYYGDKKVKDEARDEYGFSLIERKHSYFADGFIQDRNPLFTVKYFMSDQSEIVIDAYEANSGQIIMNSSLNPETWFLDHEDVLLNMYFPPLGYFVDYRPAD